jgi:hypothetical protein
MGWWSVQRYDYRSPLVELADTTNSVKIAIREGSSFGLGKNIRVFEGLSPTP